jgi:dCMP deaminase
MANWQELKNYSPNNKYHDTNMKIAELYSQHSSANKLKVGCVIVNFDERVVSVGYNGTLKDDDNTCEDENNKTLPHVFHAEENAIIYCAKKGISLEGTKLYCTHLPCVNCAKLIVGAGIIEVYYRNEYKCTRGLELFKKANISVYKKQDNMWILI